MIEIDVVGARRSGFKSYGLADDKGDGLGLRLPHYLGRGRPALGLVQHLVCEFMDKGAELLGLGLAGKNGNFSAIAHAQSRGDLLAKDKLDTLTLDERNETVAVLAYRAGHLP